MISITKNTSIYNYSISISPFSQNTYMCTLQLLWGKVITEIIIFDTKTSHFN